jgi:hypothetical protein
VVLFQSHFLSSVLAKFLAKTCYKFMTFWQNRAKFTTALSWVLAIFASTRKQIHLASHLDRGGRWHKVGPWLTLTTLTTMTPLWLLHCRPVHTGVPD